MNKTEKTARQWVAKEHSVLDVEVIFSTKGTPDFTTPDGTKYEVKRLYGDKIIIFPAQASALREQSDIKVLVFAVGATSPLAVISAQDITSAVDNGTMAVRNIGLVLVEKRAEPKYQLDYDLQERLDNYMRENTTEGAKTSTATLQKSLDEFLTKRGY